MEEKKTLKIKKPYLIIFTLAISFAIMGFIDLKVNAAELTTHTVVANSNEYRYKDGVLVDGYPQISDELILTSNEPIYAYYYTTFESPSSGDVIKNLEFISRSAITDSNGYSSASFAYNGETWYIYQFYQQTGFFSPYTGYFEFGITGAEKIYKLNQPYDFQNFITALNNGTLKFEEIIDYSQLQTDDNMPIPTNFVLSKISNNIVVGLKDYDEMYDYIKWSNTSDLPIQVQVCPIVQVYKNKNLGFSYGDFVRNYDSNYLVDEILEQPTISYIFEVRNDYFVSDIDPYPHTDFLNYYKDIYDKEDTGTFGKHVLNYTCGYRFRYVDIDNMKAGPWIHVWPDRIIGKTVTYITYSDGTFTNDIDSTGTQNKYDGAELDEMIENTETENFYKDKYDVSDSNIDVGEATNWLTSVANFIKGTPSFVGSVMSFLPEPIRYGMYVCLFLGIIASGYAIVKALI